MKLGKATAFEDFVAPPAAEKKKRAPRRGLSPSQFNAVLQETRELKDLGEWSAFKPRHLVGLYCLLHAHVYGVAAEDARESFLAAQSMARRILAQDFSDNAQAAVEFMRWVWTRESKRYDRRDRDNDFRIGWRLQFGHQYLTDYRVFRARSRKKR